LDVALLDGPFWSLDELPGRSIEDIPHPLMMQTTDAFQGVVFVASVPCGVSFSVRRGGIPSGCEETTVEKNMKNDDREEFARVLEEGKALQGHLPWLEMVAVGGTAAAVHAQHRYSTDVDQVTPRLSGEFEEVKEALSSWEGWQLNRQNRPWLLLGERHGVQLGLRQQRRIITLERVQIDDLIVPTIEETSRIKAFLCTDRQVVRDFLDLAALADRLGDDRAIDALRFLNVLYEGAGNQSCITRLAEVTQQAPLDLDRVDLSTYHGIQSPYDDWQYVERRCKEVARRLFLMEMEGAVATDVEEFLKVANLGDTRQSGTDKPPTIGA